MTHTRHYIDDEGTFGPWARDLTARCPRCRGTIIVRRIWESHDGAFEDAQFACEECHHRWWIDGIDS